MEDLPVKAIVIGVSVFVTMAVLSALMLYFNTAKSVADIVNKRTDIAEEYDRIMNGDVFEDTLTGVEVRSLINKYAGNESVQINILSVSGKKDKKYWKVNTAWCRNTGEISEQRLDLINPVWNCTVTKKQSGEKTILRVYLDVDITEED